MLKLKKGKNKKGGELNMVIFENKGIVYELNLSSKKAIVKYANPMIQKAKILENIQGCVVETIESRAFYFCEKLKEIVIPDSIKNIKNQAFCGCKKLNHINSNNSLNVEIVGFYVFKGCSNLKQVKFNNLKLLGKGCFENCLSLDNVVFPKNGFKVLEENVFYNNPSLKSFTFPKGLELVKNNFNKCESLEQLTFFNKDLEVRNFILNISKECILYGDDGYKVQEMALYGYKFILRQYEYLYNSWGANSNI